MTTTVETYRFWTPAWTGKGLTLTRYRLTMEEAAERYPGCKPDLGSLELREVYGPGERVPMGMSSPPMNR